MADFDPSTLISSVADLPCLTEVFGAAIACVDPDLPGALLQSASALELERSAQVLIVFVDGLGLNLLESHFGHAPTLRAHRNELMMARTIVPSTTAAAITAFGTGAQPGQTRMVGYSVPHPSGKKQQMNLLAFDTGIDAEKWQPVPTLCERLAEVGMESVVISPPAFATSGLTRAALRGSRHVGAISLTDRINAALKELRRGVPVVYLYWSDIDHFGHKYGSQSGEWTAALEEFDAGLKKLLTHLPQGVETVLTADHGMVDVRQPDLVDVYRTPALKEGVRMIAGETRAVQVHAEPGQGEAVRERWADFLGDRAWVLSPEQAAVLMGAGPGIELIGDALVLMRERWGVVDSRVQTPGAIGLVGVHGSITDDELLIPVMRLS